LIWIPGCAAFLIHALVSFAAWLRQQEASSPADLASG
jgi:hypothetical protein